MLISMCLYPHYAMSDLSSEEYKHEEFFLKFLYL